MIRRVVTNQPSARYFFEFDAVRELINRYKPYSAVWIDPFAGFNSPAEITNDIDPTAPTTYHLDAAEFVACCRDVDGAFFDPPTTKESVFHSATIFSDVRDGLARVIRPGGYVISHGYSSAGIGRGLEMVECLVLCHAPRNDTFAVVEQKPW